VRGSRRLKLAPLQQSPHKKLPCASCASSGRIAVASTAAHAKWLPPAQAATTQPAHRAARGACHSRSFWGLGGPAPPPPPRPFGVWGGGGGKGKPFWGAGGEGLGCPPGTCPRGRKGGVPKEGLLGGLGPCPPPPEPLWVWWVVRCQEPMLAGVQGPSLHAAQCSRAKVPLPGAPLHGALWGTRAVVVAHLLTTADTLVVG